MKINLQELGFKLKKRIKINIFKLSASYLADIVYVARLADL